MKLILSDGLVIYDGDNLPYAASLNLMTNIVDSLPILINTRPDTRAKTVRRALLIP